MNSWQQAACLTPLIVAFWIESTASGSVNSPNEPPQVPITQPNQAEVLGQTKSDARTKRISLTVQIINGDQKGSGIIIRDRSRRSWIATNRHVVGNSQQVCVRLWGGAILPGRVVQSRGPSPDIAFVSIYQIKEFEAYSEPDTHTDLNSIIPVVATGYNAETDEYLETTGVTIPILRNEILESGYSVTYSSQIEKGMSGGGIFSDKGQVLGINGLHGDPLWQGSWYDSKGKMLSESLGKKLDAVSVGIPIRTVISELDHVVAGLAVKYDNKFSCLNRESRI